jgi:hypothetical protein
MTVHAQRMRGGMPWDLRFSVVCAGHPGVVASDTNASSVGSAPSVGPSAEAPSEVTTYVTAKFASRGSRGAR